MTTRSTGKLPTFFIPHGGGPCFFMDWSAGPPDTWARLAAWLRTMGERFGDVRALLVVSGHWLERVVTVQSSERPPLLFDYYGFPPHTYALTWPAPGAPRVAARIRELLAQGGISCREDSARGFDHGAFIPLKVAFPDAAVPALQLSLDASLDPSAHLRIGRALAPLREEGVLIVGSGMSFHNMSALMRPGASLARSRRFDDWLAGSAEDPAIRDARLLDWEHAPEARYCHPHEDHLLPLLIAAGAATGEPGRRAFGDQVMGVRISAFEFGDDDAARPPTTTFLSHTTTSLPRSTS